MLPVYANNVHVTRSAKNNEFTVTFNHIYTEHSLTPGDKGLVGVSAPMCETVGSFVLNRETILMLHGLLSKTVQDMNAAL